MRDLDYAATWTDRVDDAEWSDLLASDPRSTPLQRPAFHRAFSNAFVGFRPQWIEVRDGAGRLCAGLPVAEQSRLGLVRRVSGLAGCYGGPVVDPRAPRSEEILADEFSRASPRIVFRELVWPRAEPPRGRWRGLRALPTATVDVDASRDFDGFLRALFPKSRRVEGERSDRRGMTWAIEADGCSLSEFYPIYLERCAAWKTSPVPQAALEVVMGELEESMLFVARGPEGDLAGAHLCLDLGDELFAWLGTSVRRKDVFAPAVLIREELRWCHERGRAALNLGASVGSTGVKTYKDLVGAVDRPRWIVREDRRFWVRRPR